MHWNAIIHFLFFWFWSNISSNPITTIIIINLNINSILEKFPYMHCYSPLKQCLRYSWFEPQNDQKHNILPIFRIFLSIDAIIWPFLAKFWQFLPQSHDLRPQNSKINCISQNILRYGKKNFGEKIHHKTYCE